MRIGLQSDGIFRTVREEGKVKTDPTPPCHCEGVERPKQSQDELKTMRLPRSPAKAESLAMRKKGDCRRYLNRDRGTGVDEELPFFLLFILQFFQEGLNVDHFIFFHALFPF